MIIESILDTDLYKFTMMQCVLHQFPQTDVEYSFRCRNKLFDFKLHVIERIKNEIKNLAHLRMKTDELEFLRLYPFFTPDFIEFLRMYRFNPDFVTITALPNGTGQHDLDISISGPWLHTILFEIPILSIVNECYFEDLTESNPDVDWAKVGLERLDNKIELIKNAPAGFTLAEFGGRRRFSVIWHREVLTKLKECPQLIGTSNVWLAKELGLTPIGTMAHELLQAGQAMAVRLLDSQKFMLEAWVKEYRGSLGIALTDVIGIDAFINDFDLYFAKLYDGVRHDSGDPYEFGNKMIAHYESLGIDPKTKTLIFSDGLHIEKAIEIYNYFKDKIRVSFGIGTNLTNDVGWPALNIVLKMVTCNGQDVAKVSDSPGKTMCRNITYITYLKSVFGR